MNEIGVDYSILDRREDFMKQSQIETPLNLVIIFPRNQANFKKNRAGNEVDKLTYVQCGKF